MSEKSLFFDSVGGDRKYNSSDFTTYFSKVLTDGVFPNPSNNLQVVSNGNMTVTVKPGGANIKGYLYNLDENKIITIEPATTTRKDSIVIRWDIGQRKISVEYKQGIIEPTRNASIIELVLAEITVNAGASSISQSNIYDTRQNTIKCGLVNSLIEADTTELFAGFEEGFNTWFDNIKGLLSTDQAGNLQLQIDTINTQMLGKASKDGTLQSGLNAEKVGGKSVDELTSKTDFDTFVNSKGVVNGIAKLNSNGVIAFENIPKFSNVIYSSVQSISVSGLTIENIPFDKYKEIEINLSAYYSTITTGDKYVKINSTILAIAKTGYSNSVYLRCKVDNKGNITYYSFSQTSGSDVTVTLDSLLKVLSPSTKTTTTLIANNKLSLDGVSRIFLEIIGYGGSEI